LIVTCGNTDKKSLDQTAISSQTTIEKHISAKERQFNTKRQTFRCDDQCAKHHSSPSLTNNWDTSQGVKSINVCLDGQEISFTTHTKGRNRTMHMTPHSALNCSPWNITLKYLYTVCCSGFFIDSYLSSKRWNSSLQISSYFFFGLPSFFFMIQYNATLMLPMPTS